ncbi:MAG TPA: hypothetical protein VJ750_04715 [Rhizomicrobium sp.]|nr:hypothetical protein [Rhizomicrobium sp.]
MSLLRHRNNNTIIVEMSNENKIPVAAVSRRNCGTCTLCCKLLGVQEIRKPAGMMCGQCVEGSGCRIYDSRPRQCRLFNCYFLTNPRLREQWRPSKSRMVIVVSPDGLRLGVFVDPARPGAWRREPFYSTLKEWSRQALATPGVMGQVLVSVGKHTMAILPDRNVDVGLVEEDEVVITEAVPGLTNLSFNAFKLKRDDPRAISILGSIQQRSDSGYIF